MPDSPAIGFQFCFARTPRADSATESRERCARSNQPRQQVLQLGKLNLQLAFTRPCTPGENVEDELRAIDDLAIERRLQVPQLCRTQLVVEDDDVGAEFVARRGERRDLATAEERRGIGLRPVLQNSQHDRCTSCCRESSELVQRMFGIDLTRRVEEADQSGALMPAPP